jgi:hypothetical protein
MAAGTFSITFKHVILLRSPLTYAHTRDATLSSLLFCRELKAQVNKFKHLSRLSCVQCQ